MTTTCDESTYPALGHTKDEVHLCDNYSHLLVAVTDLATRPPVEGQRRLILFIDDGLRLSLDLVRTLSALAWSEIICVSDRAAIEEFARLPRALPAVIRRNASWHRGRPLRPSGWIPDYLSGRSFARAYVYHPGFFLSKVVAGRSAAVTMRDSGYANYVEHRVRSGKALLRLLAGRRPRTQVWGEEPWIDAIEVVRPDQLPPRVRHKARKLGLDQLMATLEPERSRAIAAAFWDDSTTPTIPASPVALLLTQPIDLLGICSTAQRVALYRAIVARLESFGYRVVAKAHPRETSSPPSTTDGPGPRAAIPATFPIEAWVWLGLGRFDLAVSLNSTSLSSDTLSFAEERLQLIPPERFYRHHWDEWPDLIERSFSAWQAQGAGAPSGRDENGGSHR